jgi:SAM-dependent methyltransferase
LSDDGTPRRERKQTARARRLRVPLDDVPRQAAMGGAGAAGVDLGDIEIDVAESIAPPAVPLEPPRPSEPVVELSYVASDSVVPSALASAPPQGFAISAPPQGFAISAPPQGFAISAPPQEVAVPAPLERVSPTPGGDSPRTSLVIVQRSVVITGEPPASRDSTPAFSPPPLRVPDFGPYAQGIPGDLEPENTLPGTEYAPTDARVTDVEGTPAEEVARALAGDLSAWQAADSAGAAVVRAPADLARAEEEHEFGDDDLIPGEPTRVTRGNRTGAVSRPPSQPPNPAARPPSQPPRASVRPPSQPPRPLPPPARGSRPPSRPPSFAPAGLPTPVLPLASLAAGLPPLPPVESEPSAATLEALAGIAGEYPGSAMGAVHAPAGAAAPEVEVAVEFPTVELATVELATDELAAEELAALDLAVDEQVATPVPPPAPVAAAPRPPPAPPAPPSTARVTPPAVPADATPAATETLEPARRKKRTRIWWEDFFNDDYLRTVRTPSAAQVARQCDFLEYSLGLQKGATILDVGCGLGLQAVELASRGYLVVGFDLSLPMLSRAADEAQDREIKMNFLHGDMREMTFDGSFDAVICLGTTFGYFDDDTNRQVLERMKRALKPQGLLLLDTVNRDFVVQGQPNLVWFEGDGCVCMEETQFNYISSRLHVKRTVILDDGRQRENEYGIRLYPLHEIGQLMHQMGFRVVEVSGMEATPGVYFGATSPRLILVAERRVERPSAGTLPGMPGPAGASRPPSEPPRATLPGEPTPTETE